jgi:branched-chain amino acid transport system permease protein
MRTSIKNGIRFGAIIGVVLLFFHLTGFSVVASSMLGSLLGNVEKSATAEQLPALNLAFVLALMGMIAGGNASKSKENDSWSNALVSGTVAGAFAGLLTGIFIFVVGFANFKEIDLRNYLPEIGPDIIESLLFGGNAAAPYIYLGLLTVSGLVGAVLSKGVIRADWRKTAQTNSVQSFKDFVQKPGIQKVFGNKIAVYTFLALAALLLYFLPTQWGSYWNYIMGTVGIYILLGLGLNIIVGLSGQLVLGYVAFFAIGAYAFGLMTAPEPHAIGMNFWLAILFAIFAAAMTGVLLGLPILSLRGDYLAIVTLGFGEIIRILIKSDMLTDFTNGPSGLSDLIQPKWMGQTFNDVNFFHLIVIFVVIASFIANRLQYSRTGRAWEAISADQTVAKATGINTYKYKLLALALGAAFAGLGGALFASRNQFTGPEDHILMVSINVLCLVIVGGMGSIPGVIVGAFVLKGVPELLRDLESYRLLAFGALLVVMMIMRPEGLWPTGRRAMGTLFYQKHPKDSPPDGEVQS